MTGTLLSLGLAVLLAGADDKSDGPRKPHPFAPSLPELTDEEEKRYDEIIDRFIQYDTGRLRGAEGRKALEDFQRLGPDSIPALVRGLNRAANINHSCPVTVIDAKLRRLLGPTRDVKLAEFVRDEIGNGVGPTRHAAVLQNLRMAVTLHRNTLMRAGIEPPTAPVVSPGSPGERPLRQFSTGDLLEAAGKERGLRLKMVLSELANRPGDEPVAALGVAAASYERDVKDFARKLLLQNLSRKDTNFVKAKLKDEKAEVRLAAVRVTAGRSLKLVGDLIERLEDNEEGVREAARQSLMRLAGSDVDFGPKKGATKAERAKAAEQWKEWWDKRASR
jgi:hypothetical protein